MAIHPLAHVDPAAEISAGAAVGPFAVVGPDVVLHDGVEVLPHGVVFGPSEIGPGTRIFPGAVLGADPQDTRWRGEPTRLVVGRHNTFREGSTAHRASAHGSRETRIGDDNLFMAQAHVAHDCTIGNRCILANTAALAGHVEVGDRAVLGGLAGVHQHARVGRLAMVAAGSMVSQDVPPFGLVQGDRARLVGLNRVGLGRAGVASGTIKALRSAYDLLFGRAGPLRAEAIRRVAETWGEVPEVQELLAFVSSSRRGVCRVHGAPDGAP
ncbi:MAG: acyl-ACP--UDP-N-acetylglucosamine O-acyltransferase [Deltaproteobacteria bacterium]|nr:acyl-ACP--UDP-N-acetylglucosamine O-acyltransferase [Deltaproteobacteria bacterium]